MGSESRLLLGRHLNTLTDRFGRAVHGVELSYQPKSAPIMAAEAFVGEYCTGETINMLQQPPQRMITAEEESRVQAVLVS